MATVSERGCTLRCSVEKRTMCRDLQKWSKTLLCMIGLENVAERMVSRRKPHGQYPLRISPFVEAHILSHSKVACGDDEANESAGSAALPQDWDPKERCAICIQIAEKEELAKKATQTSLQHSRSRKELRAASERTKEIPDNKTTCADSASSTSTGHSQSLLSPNKQQPIIDWRSVGASTANSSHLGTMNMFRSGTNSGQSASSSCGYNSAMNLTSMFPPGYPVFDLNQLYWNELLSQCNKAVGSGSTNPYSMMSSLALGMPSMPPPPLGYSLGSPFTFPNLVPSLSGQSSQSAGLSTSLDEPLDLTKKLPGKVAANPAGLQEDCAKTSALGSGTASVGDTASPISFVVGSKGGPSSSPNCSSSSNGNKRTYSQADLQAAIDACRNKKLGTRKSATDHGIPRSTLRNKLAKLEATNDDPSSRSPSVPSTCASPGSGNRRLRRKHDQSKMVINGNEEQKLTEQSGTSVVRDALCGRTTTSSEDSSTSLASSSSSFPCAGETSTNYGDLGNWTALTAELARHRAMEALWKAAESNGTTASTLNKETMSFQSTITNGSPAVKCVLQEAVCSALNENLKLKCGSSEVGMDSSCSPLSLVSTKQASRAKRPSSRRRGAKSLLDQSVTMVKIERPDQCVSTGGGSSNADETGDPNKKIRPKRGQYRRYDKNALAEAVHAVRRGEMSVHRAGSFYGVPHSTLEYKVKERNLLRPKKRDQKKKLAEGNAEALQAPATSSQSPLEAGKSTQPYSSDQGTETVGTTKQSKSARKMTAQEVCDPFDGMLHADPATFDRSFDSPVLATKSGDNEEKQSSSSSSANAVQGQDPAEEAGQDHEGNESDDGGNYNSFKYYEAGYKAASHILQRMQDYSTRSNGATAAEDTSTSQAVTEGE